MKRLWNDFLLQIFLQGHSGKVMPRRLRRLIAGSEIHRAWVLGYKGFFEEDGVRYGPANPYGSRFDPLQEF